MNLLFFKVQPKPHNWTGRGYCVKPCKVKLKAIFFQLMPGWRILMFKIDLFHLDQVSGMEDGHLFDLGSRKLEVLHLPGHTPGSIGSLT